MNVIWVEDDAEVAECASDAVRAAVRGLAQPSLALPTGRTPLGLYACLADAVRGQRLDASAWRAYNLDEFVGLGADHPQSYACYLATRVVAPLGLAPARVRLLDGLAADPAAECAAHQAAIEAGGGLDLAILGLGANGHVAFNEPGADWSAPARVVELSAQTQAEHRAQVAANEPAPPARAMTLGLPTLLAARAVVLLVSGAQKFRALAQLLGGSADPRWPVSAFFAHPALTVIAPAGLRASR